MQQNIEPKVRKVSSAIFVLAAALPNTFSLSNKFSRNHVTQCFVGLEKAYDQFRRDDLWRVLQSTVLKAARYWLSNHCTTAQKFVSASVELNQNHSPFVLDIGKSAYCYHSPLPT